ncbi:MAG: AMP-binding protein [Sphingomonas sp.]
MSNAILYHGEPNGPSLTVLAAAFEKAVPLDLRAIDLAAGERHGGDVPLGIEAELSIEGEGPVLVADGVAMADSVFVACYLDDVGSGPALRPADPYARWEVMAWCRQTIERTAPAAAYLGTRETLAPRLAAMPDGAFARLSGSIASVDLAERWAAARAGDFDEGQLADSRAKIAQATARIEVRLADGRDWLFGGFGIADLETYAWLAGMPALVPEAFADVPRTAAWMARVKARPSVARALALSAGGRARDRLGAGPRDKPLGLNMRSIDYFDRGHDLDPQRTCLIDTVGGERLSFAEVKLLTERIATAMRAGGFESQAPVALYGPNSAAIMVALLAMWRANGKWIPVNTRNALEANAGYLNYVRCGWMFYHSSLAADVANLKAHVRRCATSSASTGGWATIPRSTNSSRISRRATCPISPIPSARWTRSSASSRPAAPRGRRKASTSPT